MSNIDLKNLTEEQYKLLATVIKNHETMNKATANEDATSSDTTTLLDHLERDMKGNILQKIRYLPERSASMNSARK